MTLEVRGRLDVDAADQLQEALRDALGDARLVVLDLQASEFIDPVGVYAIVRASRAAQAAGRRLIIVRAPAAVDAMLRLDDTDGGLDIVETTAAARLDPRGLGGLVVGIEASSSPSGQPHVLACNGEIDAATAPQLRDAIAGLDPGNVIVDLSATSFMDSTGVSTLLKALRRLTRQEHRLVVVCPAGSAREVIRLTALLETLHVVDDRAAAERIVAR